MTICTKCKHYLYDPKGQSWLEESPRWYWQYCKAHSIPESIDPCTGEKGYKGINDLVRFQHCRDLNQGDCQTYEPKTTWKELMKHE